MIDTVHLRLVDYQVRDDHRLMLRRGLVEDGALESERDAVLFLDASGEPVKGVSASYAEKGVSLRIQRSKRGSVGCTVIFSAAKQVHGTNYLPIDQKGMETALRAVQGVIDRAGIEAEVVRSKLVRVDLFRNIEAPESFGAYETVLREHVRMGRTHSEELGVTSYLWRNTQQQVAIYDKRAEMMAKGHPDPAPGQNVHRVEWRMTNGRKVRAALRVATAGDLLGAWSTLDACYERVLR
jgi:hypothetical protein